MSQHLLSRCLLILPALLGLSICSANAGNLNHPTEKPILTVSGKIGVTNKGDTAQFDRPMLEALGTATVETTTPWYDGSVKFEGVPLAKLIEAVEAKGDKLLVQALNDYSSEIPLDDAIKYNVVLALKRNDEYMPIRDKGPLFLVYPFDSDPELHSQKFYSRSVWQISQIVVK